jgi:hypothetical protein
LFEYHALSLHGPQQGYGFRGTVTTQDRFTPIKLSFEVASSATMIQDSDIQLFESEQEAQEAQFTKMLAGEFTEKPVAAVLQH